MGVDLREFVKPVAVEIDPRTLIKKVVAIDAYNALYQFLATIRQPNGEPFTAPDGRITSHLIGLFYRTINLVEMGIKPVYVFDGKPPELKVKTLEKRRMIREEAKRKRLSAMKRGNVEEAVKYAKQGAILTRELKEMAIKLLDLMALPRVQAPSEGEAQAAYMAKKGDAYASVSQDYDSLLFGTPRLIRNLSVTHKRKLPGKNERVEVPPELIELQKLLKYRRITHEQLIDIAILLGTDYNEKPIKGIGPKRAIELIRMYGSADRVPGVPERFKEIYPEVKRLFLEPEVTDDYKLDRDRQPDIEGIVKYLVDELGFNEKRVRKALERYMKGREKRKQQTIDDFLGGLI